VTKLVFALHVLATIVGALFVGGVLVAIDRWFQRRGR
jgi:hypothetical protein